MPTPAEPPPLPVQNRSFLSFLTTQAFGAFNDNVFKQMVLLLSVGYVAVADFQSVVQLLFALPFLLFSGFAGDVADRVSKGHLMVRCKIAEIGVMSFGFLAFLWYTQDGTSTEPPVGLWLLAGVTFLMGTQSAFFGPPKYGGLPALVRKSDLGQATGLTQMTTFLAIIFGVTFAGYLLEWFGDRLWIPGLITIVIACIGTFASLGIERLPPTAPEREIGGKSFFSVFPTLGRVFKTDALMVDVMLTYAFFWLVGGVCLVAINSYGRLQLGLDYAETSLLVSTLSMGIALGSVAAARLSRKSVRIGLIVPGMIGMIVCLLALLLIDAPAPTAEQIELYIASKQSTDAASAVSIVPRATAMTIWTVAAILTVLGASAGLMSVPLLAFIQARPPDEEKGTTIAMVNWVNWVFILGSAAVYGVGMSITSQRAEIVMASMGVLTAVVMAWFVPRILRCVKRERPEFVWTPEPPPGE